MGVHRDVINGRGDATRGIAGIATHRSVWNSRRNSRASGSIEEKGSAVDGMLLPPRAPQ
jgi:hypothetical protein